MAWEVALAQRPKAHGPGRHDTAIGVIGSLGNLFPFFAGRPPLGKGAALGKGDDEVTAGDHGGQARQAKTLLEQCAVETRHVLLQQFYPSTIISQAAVGVSQVVLCRDREADILQVSSNCQGAMTGLKSGVRFAGLHKMGSQIGCDPSQPVGIAQSLGESCGVLQVDEDLPEFAQRVERIAQREAEIDGPSEGVVALWEMLHGPQRLLKGCHRLSIGRPRQGLLPGLSKVGHGLIP
jgi:hypothetical protein